jgi:hypothetical protein
MKCGFCFCFVFLLVCLPLSILNFFRDFQFCTSEGIVVAAQLKKLLCCTTSQEIVVAAQLKKLLCCTTSEETVAAQHLKKLLLHNI